jgi:hypothetical protein
MSSINETHSGGACRLGNPRRARKKLVDKTRVWSGNHRDSLEKCATETGSPIGWEAGWRALISPWPAELDVSTEHLAKAEADAIIDGMTVEQSREDSGRGSRVEARNETCTSWCERNVVCAQQCRTRVEVHDAAALSADAMYNARPGLNVHDERDRDRGVVVMVMKNDSDES